MTGGPVIVMASLRSYLVGMSTLMVAVTVLTAVGRGAIVRRLVPAADRLSRITRGLLFIAGVVQIYLFVVRYNGLEMVLGG